MNHAINQARSRSRHSQKGAESDAILHPRNILKSFFLTIGIGAASVLVSAMIAYFSDDPNRLILPLGLLASFFTALLGGYAATRIHKHSALLGGMINGCLFTALMMLLSPIAKGYASSYSAPLSATLHIGFLLLSVVGAYLGLHKRPKKRKRRK